MSPLPSELDTAFNTLRLRVEAVQKAPDAYARTRAAQRASNAAYDLESALQRVVDEASDLSCARYDAGLSVKQGAL